MSNLSHIIYISLMQTKKRLHNLFLINAAMCHTIQQYILPANTIRPTFQHSIVAIRATDGIAIIKRIVG